MTLLSSYSNLITRTMMALALAALALFVLFLLSIPLKTNNLPAPLLFHKSTEVGGPFEASNTNARYALVESIVQRRSFNLTREQARFSVPDVVETQGQFAISFMPGVSLAAVPFFLLGSYWGFGPLATFGLNIVLAAANGIALFMLVRKLGGSRPAALLGSLTFLFATNALVYAGTLTQHHGSTLILLLSLSNALSTRTWWRNILFGLYCGAGFLLDFPNVFLLFPVGLYILAQHVSWQETALRYSLSIRTSFVFIGLAILPLLAVVGWYNLSLSGSPTRFTQFSARTNAFDTAEKIEQDRLASLNRDPYQTQLPFSTRLQLAGAYTLFISDERSWLGYSPVVLLGIGGLWLLARRRPQAAMLLIAVISTNILIYVSFGDPWGGWSFGPRYLIPAAALLSATLGIALSQARRHIPFLIIFSILALHSVRLSTLGALTTANIPPKQEAQALDNPIPHTSEYNRQRLEQGRSQSIVYLLWFRDSWHPTEFHQLYILMIASLFAGGMFWLVRGDKEHA